ncbi:helix-turn-helix transcriptional regulator [Burkholderia vietnamiensis]|uniref:helix-turn-helix transcriptional regulator n=1 Tax=Burkholderia vietnamiensis TaxID=60552 RepID=UPI001D13C8F5|nr:AlpA family phage regulatory protein [Burkholderia vietnamiensis]UEC01751.1 AlpA family phage regulatory protein [Burkholderia vietnamiensis]
MQTTTPHPDSIDRSKVVHDNRPAYSLPDTGFVRQKLLLRFVPFSKSTLWRRVGEGKFPSPVKLSAGITAWRVEDVRRWISEWAQANPAIGQDS